MVLKTQKQLQNPLQNLLQSSGLGSIPTSDPQEPNKSSITPRVPVKDRPELELSYNPDSQFNQC